MNYFSYLFLPFSGFYLIPILINWLSCVLLNCLVDFPIKIIICMILGESKIDVRY